MTLEDISELIDGAETSGYVALLMLALDLENMHNDLNTSPALKSIVNVGIAACHDAAGIAHARDLNRATGV